MEIKEKMQRSDNCWDRKQFSNQERQTEVVWACWT